MKRKSLDKGKRYVVVHAGGKDGFVEGALLVFSSKEQDGDYHKTFNGPIFENWLTNQLLPSLPSPSVVVLDNASYHSVQVSDKLFDYNIDFGNLVRFIHLELVLCIHILYISFFFT